MSMTSKVGDRVRSGSGIHPGRILFKAASGTMNLTSVRFFDATGLQLPSQIGGSAITLPLTSTYKSLKDLVEGLGADGIALWDGIEGAVEGVMADNVSAEVHASFGEAAAVVPTEIFAVDRPLMVGCGVPDELKGFSGGTVTVSGEVLVSAGYKQSARVTATLAALNDAITIPCVGYGQAIFDFVNTGTAPTMAPEISFDGGTTWKAAKSYGASTGGSVTCAGTSYAAGSTQRYYVDCSGATHVRYRVSAVGTGPHTVYGFCQASAWNPTANINSGGLQVLGYNLHDAVAAAALLQMGLEARTSDGTPVSNGDSVRAMATSLGKQVTLADALPGQGWDYSAVTGGVTTATQTTIQARVVGSRHYVKDLDIVNRSTTAVEVTIYACDSDTGLVGDANSVVLWRGELKEGETSGIARSFGKARRGGVSQAIRMNTSAAGKVYANLGGFMATE